MLVQSMLLSEAVRVTILTTISFVIALLITPLWFKFLKNYKFGKQLRDGAETPVFAELHKNKAGTPTGGGIIIWSTVIGMAIFFDVMRHLFGGGWTYFNFVDRAETYLPIAALLHRRAPRLARRLAGRAQARRRIRRGIEDPPKSGRLSRSSHSSAPGGSISALGGTCSSSRLSAISRSAGGISPSLFLSSSRAHSRANETDGLDGLLGGVSLFAFVSLATVAFVLHRYHLAAFSGAVIGALLAFLWFNIYPAKFFMGDTGSMSLGITIGVVAMLTNTTLILPFFTIILVIESLSVIIQVISKKFRHGKKIFRSAPIHHHFEALGWPESQVTMRFWIVCAVFCALGLVIFFLSH